MFAHAIQRETVSDSLCSLFGLAADGTTHFSACEHVSCCLQFVDSTLTAQDVFLGFHSAWDSWAETLLSCVKDTFLSNCCEDVVLTVHGSNMSVHLNDVQAKLKAECPGAAVTTHRTSFCKRQRGNWDSLQTRYVSVVTRDTSKRKTLFQSLFGSEEVVCNVLGLRPLSDSGEAQWRRQFFGALEWREREKNTHQRCQPKLHFDFTMWPVKEHKLQLCPTGAGFLSGCYPQTRGPFKDVETFAELSLCQLPHQKDHSPASDDWNLAGVPWASRGWHIWLQCTCTGNTFPC